MLPRTNTTKLHTQNTQVGVRAWQSRALAFKDRPEDAHAERLGDRLELPGPSLLAPPQARLRVHARHRLLVRAAVLVQGVCRAHEQPALHRREIHVVLLTHDVFALAARRAADVYAHDAVRLADHEALVDAHARIVQLRRLLHLVLERVQPVAVRQRAPRRRVVRIQPQHFGVLRGLDFTDVVYARATSASSFALRGMCSELQQLFRKICADAQAVGIRLWGH
jgi:hypothetical protein